MDNTQIAIVRPRNFQDAATVGEYYRQGTPVIISLEDVDHALATRIIDFVSGLVLGLSGDIERVSRRAFLIVPADASILTTHDALTDEGFFNQALRRDEKRREAAELGIDIELHHFDVPFDELARRLEARNAGARAHECPVTAGQIQDYAKSFQPPDEAELALFARSVVHSHEA